VAGRSGARRIYWTCLMEESRLVVACHGARSSTRKPIKSVDSPERFRESGTRSPASLHSPSLCLPSLPRSRFVLTFNPLLALPFSQT